MSARDRGTDVGPSAHGQGARVLVIADDDAVLDLVTPTLGLAGYEVDQVSSGASGLERMLDELFDLAVIDTSLPGLRRIPRRPLSDVGAPAVLFLVPDTLLETVASEVGISGHDYLSKPFRIADLLVRVRLLLRDRVAGGRRRVLNHGDLRLDGATFRAWRGERELDLSPAEYRLLWELVLNAGTVLSKEQIARGVWGELRGDNAIERLVSRLRQKVDASGPALIRTHRGFGYSLTRAAR
ncbi:response regulator transcription factor [Antribacter sp. KLBMP9083]|uniref:Response regulator transcription factor n=1 Tax=Antribacter soli TaxID=2910976 RepID=A0AA41U7Y9_9MICO|nr:response regulator transcription factor [Antribacter soli]MCF4119912.1 response regulator transcription factor [Antribacter soli]